MKFKTLKSSITGQKFEAVNKKAKQAHKETVELSKKIGFEQWRIGYWCAYGGISCVMFKSIPDEKLWKKEKDGYAPKLNVKAGKEIRKLFDEVTSVSYDELNQCIGFDGAPWKHIGVSFDNDEWIGFEVDEKWNVNIPKDCTEVTTTEYNNLFRE